ncbi:hypothetical protein Rrhod_1410 [Rhodococcus rhodnii LMG 5362]|uniref:Leucine-binding protein domain-containing protein n=2 Tax=Rhodococcus rhodnii TaxID=38312 RepID=R7WPB4_9NOCA|nr:hypothetical protein Rrhod_1410 [Rhodococcus rhodnii LMG 5362]
MLSAALVLAGCTAERGPMPGGYAMGGAEPAAATSDESFGTLASPCGPGDASGATDQGVSDTEIRIGYGDDRGYTKSPGLNREMSDAMSAMIDWCNAQGGIGGRQIVGTDYDAAMTQANSVMQDACATQFMMVGHGFALDQTSEQTRIACNLAAVPGFTVSPEAANGPMTFQGVPFPVDVANGSMWFQMAEVHPELTDRFTLVGSTMPTIISSLQKIRSVAEAAGFDLLDCGVTLNYEGEASYVPFAQMVKDCGAGGLWTSRSATPNELNFFKAVTEAGVDPVLFGEATWYGEAVAEYNAGTGLIDGLMAGMQFQPLENADSVPAVAKYVELVEGRDGKTALLGMQATSSFLLWATAADACGSDLTRQCMIDELSSIHEWDGGGLHAVTDPGANLPSPCGLMVQLDGADYSQAYPSDSAQFECDERYLVRTDASTWGTELGEDRVATKFLGPAVLTPRA